MCAIENKTTKLITSQFNRDPDDLVFSKQHGMMLSRHGQDQSPRRVETKTVVIQEQGDGKVRITAKAVKDGLDRLFERGVIDEMGLMSARAFQKAFDNAGYAKFSTANPNATGTGNISIEDIMSQSMQSRNYVHYVMTLLGGSDKAMAKAVYWYVGHSKNFEEVDKINPGNNKHYWRVVLKCAIDLMASDYRRMMAGKKRK